ncbi:MAG: Fic family protein [Treponema sp.]|nr:Fic family protein [Treponema sp.]
MDGKKSAFDIDFDSYIRQGEPSQKEKSIAWATAIGLQAVDGLEPSAYLYETARRNIEGDISIEEAKKLIDSYYESKTDRTDSERETEEADKVSARITEILGEKSFSFTPNQLLSIHERLFKGVFFGVKAGKFRDYNITKKEWVLNGDTVLYASADLISETLKYDFEAEKNFDYAPLSKEDKVKHLTRFIANIWQIHPFGEGNTRTTAVFTIKYLRSLGFDVNNEPFEKNSWYFRNALVRANYTNMSKNIYMNTEFLERFFRNLLLGEKNELKNRYTHLDYDDYMKKLAENGKSDEGAKIDAKITQKITVKITQKITVNQQKILEAIKQNPYATQEELSAIVGIAKLNINKNMKKLQEQNIIRRVGADKNGYWEITAPNFL